VASDKPEGAGWKTQTEMGKHGHGLGDFKFQSGVVALLNNTRNGIRCAN
jgi:hypothetical protein